MATTYTAIRNLGELKTAFKTAKLVYVWVNWEGEDGDYIEVPKIKFLRSIGADAPTELDEDGNPTGHGGRLDCTFIKAEMRDNDVYIG